MLTCMHGMGRKRRKERIPTKQGRACLGFSLSLSLALSLSLSLSLCPSLTLTVSLCLSLSKITHTHTHTHTHKEMCTDTCHNRSLELNKYLGYTGKGLRIITKGGTVFQFSYKEHISNCFPRCEKSKWEGKKTKRCWGRAHMPKAINPSDLRVSWPQNLHSTSSPSPRPHKPNHMQNLTLPHRSNSKSLIATSHFLATSSSNSLWHSHRKIPLPIFSLISMTNTFPSFPISFVRLCLP